MNFNPYNSILFAGVLQGLLFALVILTKRYKGRATLFLAGLILSFSFNNLQYYLLDTRLVSEKAFYDYVYTPWCLLIPVCLLFYINTSLYPEKKLASGQKLLLLPFFVGLLLSLLYKFLVAPGYENKTVYEAFSYIPSLLEFLAILLNQSIYVCLFVKIRQYEKENTASKSNGVRVRLAWLKQILVFLFILTLIWLYLMLMVATGSEKTFYPLWIGISIVIYWLGHIGIYKFAVIEQRKNIKKSVHESKSRYTITDRQKNEHITALEQLLIAEKRFLEPDLTLDKIATELSLSKSHLSRVINAELGVGFIDYINTLRVEEAKSYLLNPEFSRYTLESIGLEAGFHSKSSFNVAFKKVTGVTPSQFKKNHPTLS